MKSNWHIRRSGKAVVIGARVRYSYREDVDLLRNNNTSWEVANAAERYIIVFSRGFEFRKHRLTQPVKAATTLIERRIV